MPLSGQSKGIEMADASSNDSVRGALSGLRVVDASRVLAGPFCGQILGDHGADVIKIEAPEGDECRGFGPPFVEGASAYFRAVNRNKRSLVIDMNLAADREVFWQLLETADVLIENFKPSTLETWGIDRPSSITERFPRLIHCRITGFGDDGPLGRLPGYDAAVQAMAGLISINGEPGGNPVRLGVPVVDLTTGMNAAMAVLLALNARHRTGRGQLADVSLYDSAVSVAHPFMTNFLASGETPRPTGNSHPNIVPYDVFQTATCPLFVAVANDRLFGKLCQALGAGHLPDDERFATNRQRVAHREALTAELSRAFATVDGESFGKALLARNVPAAPILSIADVAAAPHTLHRQMVVRHGDYIGPGVPIKLSGTPASIRSGPPALGGLSGAAGEAASLWKQ
ncbi:putative acyl-CoA transferases/carnitine dehydratase [Cupriavidus taiwanensis]|uniref:Acyl-CoA transferases/carnitine dehydratase n=2 Tax=Cupriavidus taiwanensis TaxID=164546 RepID=A0A975X4G1_9BURK|nr:putative acyl-CoA transferases/carnitine dehydratase [Cupriavidus taiwanensis]